MAHTTTGTENEAAIPAIASLAAVADALGEAALAADACELARRVAERRFFVACVGQFKRGKSSLVNALVGASILPTGVAPVTTVVTVVRYGESRAARVTLPSGTLTIEPSALRGFVAEDENPGNAKRVRAVEVFVPADLLRSGLCLVDTPGIGSVLAHDTAATEAFVPRIDAAVVVLGTDPPISGDELRLVARIVDETDAILFVLNKADRFPPGERAEARRYAEGVLHERFGRPVGPLFEVSATERLGGGGEPRDWDALRTALGRLAERSRDRLVRAAATRGARAVAARLRAEIDERTDALTRPIAESERRIDALRACALGAERSLGDLHHLMAGEEQRLALRLEQRQDAFLAPAMAHAEAGLGRRLGGLRLRRGALRREAFRAAQDVHRELVEGWRVEEVPAAERLYADGMERFVSLANAAVRDATLAAGGAAPPPLVPEAGIGVRTRLYYTELLYLTGRSPLRWVVDLLRSPAAARRAVRREAARYLRRLLVTNGSRVTHDLVEQAGDGRRRLEAEVAACLRGAHERAARALADARERTARGAGEAGAELARLRELRRRVADLDAGLACVAAGERQVAT